MPNNNKNQALDNIKERFALEVLDTYVKKTLGKKWRDHKNTLKKEYFKKNISLEEKLRNVSPGMLRIVSELEQVAGKNKNLSTQQGRKHFDITHRKKDGSPMTFEAGEIMEKLKDKKAEYEAIASSDSSVNLVNIDNIIITEVLGSERYGRVRFQGSGVNPTQYSRSSSQQYMPSGN
ncbi:hrcA [Gossypium arboreum]|uniref:HrcA n=2 Tax=Gossypium arboreum TaxID=29729 RepID=A0A0B0MD58_GOSAR|nr:hrcA [Gossypium arboreum]